MTPKLKKTLRLIIIAAVLFAAGFFPLPQTVKITLLAASYLIVGTPIILKAGRNIVRGQIFDENFLMTIATFGAVALGEYAEAVAVMLFFQIGEFFQTYAVNRSRKSIAALMNIRPDYARVRRQGQLETVSPEEVTVGSIIIVRPGEKIPLDGIVIKGQSALDTAALTGEALPREISEGENIVSGCINLSGVLEIKTTKIFQESTVAKILDLVENAASKKAGMENFITRFARWYTPTVVIIALLLALLPPLLINGAEFRDWGYRAITFLVISCPCALVISVPLSFFGGLGAASRCGILIKGSNYLEALNRAEIAVFDKTGTLTKGKFRVTAVKPAGISADELLETAAHIEAYSHHPIAVSIREAWNRPVNPNDISNVKEIFGTGITALFRGKEVAAGNARLLQNFGIKAPRGTAAGTVVYIVINKKYAGCLIIEDTVKEDAAETIERLKKNGLRLAVMLTGDNHAAAEKIGRKLKLDNVYAELLPADKVDKFEELINKKSADGKILFVGDGINDAPVLARSDIGIAMGGIGSDAAIEAADIIIMTDEPSKITDALDISRRTITIARENVAFAIGVKLLVLTLGALGYASIWAAVFADVGVSVLAILNAVRTLFYKPRHKKNPA